MTAAPFSPTSTRRQVLLGLAAAPFLPRRARAGESGFDVVVVGAGVFGGWTAWHLVRRGLKVALVDAYGVANARASSGGESRVIRIAYGADAIYSRWARASLAEWKALSERVTLPIFHQTGVLWFARRRDAYIEASLATLEELDVPVTVYDRAGLAKRWPQIDFSDVAIGFLEHETGALLARRAVQAVVQEAVSGGATLLLDKAGPPTPAGDGVRIPLASGEAIDAGVAVYACGPWLPKVFPALLEGRIVPTRQDVFFFGPAAGDRRFAPGALPVWADFNDGDIFYGLPDLESRGFKIAHDAHGPVFDPDTGRRHPDRESYEQVRAYLARRFPALADAPLVGGRVCQYENTATGDFLIDRHPTIDGVWLVGGGSGHGFKHGPALGAHVADLVTGAATTIQPRFSLATKETHGRRAVH
ncbi:MAG: FAD-dependent oxidoreductase [Alphaproteobacteria bacterium]|nr:MAG: FAD-dependent oxidoreductase [Alphaproteobacteria bacterium]